SGSGGLVRGTGEGVEGAGPVFVLPLYALLAPAAQARVFQEVPAGHRLIVVATNVAETSLTIPGIRYVVDAGRSKQRLLEGEGGMARFEVRWISQAAAAQRAGRAGRTGPGHCYRLYSSAHFNDSMPKHSAPEIANTALEGVLLVLKSMGVDKVANFPFPSPPAASALHAAGRVLEALGALQPGSQALTPVGRAMARFPIGPRHARMLLEAEWLTASGSPLAQFSEPLLEPGPLYRPPPQDAVMAWHDVTYGRHSWPLPRCLRLHPDAATRAAIFAAALLEGQAASAFAELRPLLLSSPSLLAKPEMRGVARVGELITALKSRGVSSIDSLC
ncbi:ATP-dependent RNA helicase isoform X1, partial [Haematococcus lacustris]